MPGSGFGRQKQAAVDFYESGVEARKRTTSGNDVNMLRMMNSTTTRFTSDYTPCPEKGALHFASNFAEY